MQNNCAFEELLTKVIDFMNQEALKFPEMYTGLLGSKLEDKVVEVLQQCAVGTCFEDQIVKYSGQRFPDIVIGGCLEKCVNRFVLFASLTKSVYRKSW